MMKLFSVIKVRCVLLLILFFCCISADAAGKKVTSPKKATGKKSTKVKSTEKVKYFGRVYYISVPKKPVDPVLLVWCHPSGGKAKSEFDWWKQGNITNDNVVLLCPQSKGKRWTMKDDSQFMKKVINDVIKKYSVDKKNIILGGHSSGGIFTYNFGLKNQKAFRYLIPACGLLQWRPAPPESKNLSIKIYHSTNDSVFSFKSAKTTEAYLDGLGYDVDFTQDNIGHSIGPKLGKLVRDCLKEIKAEKKKNAKPSTTK